MMAPVSSRWAKSSMTLPPAGADYHCEVLRRVADLEGIGRPEPEEAEHSVGTCIEKSDQGSEDEDEAAEREGEEHRGSLRGGDRDVLRCHLAYHHVQEHDNEKGDDQRCRESRSPRAKESQPQFEDRGHGGLRHGAQHQ